ncbi:hypothetical protein M2352_001254 [Azospirillum fermentarium]|uniref:hypothetical protein n=1 Tax=Azospirillum fermentarium TaxID=1233114 RepID=UPI0022273B97|nr:hypothetical protein [Azospirillum fermentarium]MCW2245663.1 hypothetical protein [Azospirillum fermentarium]
MLAFSAPFRAAFAALALLAAAPAGGQAATVPAAAGFVAGLGDVPAMPGLEPVDGEPMVFDKPGGRIVETMMRGPVDRRAVLAFYGQTLPQLGWKAASQTRFTREGEELRLEFATGGPAGHTTVRFVLTPR